ncbi:hypothetical protein TNCV_4438541 [Trichonephila clavipes]|nr:hypothetical protein TNCV_4438541 [Trichonephila clavipes]
MSRLKRPLVGVVGKLIEGWELSCRPRNVTMETTRSTLTDSRLFCDVIHRDVTTAKERHRCSRKPLLNGDRRLWWSRHSHVHLAAADIRLRSGRPRNPFFDPRGIEPRRPEDEGEML